jgi:kynurenine formamidase
MPIFDCSQTIEPHWHWTSTSFVSQAYAEGDEFQEFGLKWFGSGFTFTSAPGWHIPGAADLDDLDVDRFCGLASVVTISDTPRIGRHALAAAIGARPLRPIVVLRTGHGDAVPLRRRTYWTTAPAIDADCADLLAERGCQHIVVDLPLDHLEPARADGRFGYHNPGNGFRRRAHEHGLVVTENAKGLTPIPGDTVFLSALPLRGRGLTTSPSRPIALTDWPADAPVVRDLSMPLENHWRWYLEIWQAKQFERGDDADETHFVFTGHGFTHCDAPRHMERHGPTIHDLPNSGLDVFLGHGTVVDLSDLAPATPITAELLAARSPGLTRGEMVILRSDLTNKLGYTSRAWHLKAPWLTAEAAEWIVAQGVSAVVLDFPQDRVAREMPDRHVFNHEFVAHHAILGAGIPFIEDLRDIGEIGTRRPYIMAVPLKTSCVDGAPMRVVAIEW